MDKPKKISYSNILEAKDNGERLSVYVHKVIIPWHVRLIALIKGEEAKGTRAIVSFHQQTMKKKRKYTKADLKKR